MQQQPIAIKRIAAASDHRRSALTMVSPAPANTVADYPPVESDFFWVFGGFEGKKLTDGDEEAASMEAQW